MLTRLVSVLTLLAVFSGAPLYSESDLEASRAVTAQRDKAVKKLEIIAKELGMESGPSGGYTCATYGFWPSHSPQIVTREATVKFFTDPKAPEQQPPPVDKKPVQIGAPGGWKAFLYPDNTITGEDIRQGKASVWSRPMATCFATAFKDNVYINLSCITFGKEYKLEWDPNNPPNDINEPANVAKRNARYADDINQQIPRARSEAESFLKKIISALGGGSVTVKPAFSGPGTSLVVHLTSSANLKGASADFGPGITRVGSPEVLTTAKGLSELACLIKIGPAAALGPHYITVTFADGKTDEAIFTVHPLVIILDLDGARPDILLECIENGRAANLAELLGKELSAGDVGGNILNRREFEHGIYLRDTATVFPSYTFATQASIFTGVEPGVHGVTGNMIFDRLGDMKNGAPEVYGFDRNLTDALGVYYFSELADQAIRAENIYQAMAGKPGVGRSGVFYNQYARGVAPEDRKVANLVEMGAYIPSLTTGVYDRGMAAAGTDWLRAFKSKPAEQWPSIATFYFVGIDHIGHQVDATEEEKQTGYITDVIDPEIGKIVNVVSDACPGAIFILTADHGHTDVRAGKPITRAMLKQAVARDGKIDPNDLEITENGGLAHVHVRAEKNGQPLEWRNPPAFDRVLTVAESIWKMPYFDLVLVKNVEAGGWDSGYRVYTGGGKTEDIAAYLRRTKNDFGARLGWGRNENEIAFLADRLNMYTCDRSGDVVPVPTYPDFYMEDAPVQGEHGSLSRLDMTIPFMVAQWQAFDTDQMLKVLEKTVENPARPRVTDVAPTVAGFLGQSFRGRKISPRFAEAAPQAASKEPVPAGPVLLATEPPLVKVPAPNTGVAGGMTAAAASKTTRPPGQGYYRLKEGYPKIMDRKQNDPNSTVALELDVPREFFTIHCEEYAVIVSFNGLGRTTYEGGRQYTFTLDGTWKWNKDAGRYTSCTPGLDWRTTWLSIIDAQPRHGDLGAISSAALRLGRYSDGRTRYYDRRDITLKFAKTGSPGTDHTFWINCGSYGRLVWVYEWVAP